MKRISKDIWAVFKLLYQNKGRFSINALLLQLIMIFISSTYLILLFNMMLKVAGQSQLTINNWTEIVSHPASVILLIIFILSVAFLIYVEFSLKSTPSFYIDNFVLYIIIIKVVCSCYQNRYDKSLL